MSDTISYIVIQKVDMNAACAASAKSTKSSGIVKQSDGVVWANTVAFTMEGMDLQSVARDTTKEGIKLILDKLKVKMSVHLMSVLVIPEIGKDRDGKDFTVTDKVTGQPKWSSWDQTRRIFAYLGDIAKVIAYGKETILYPESMKVAPRCDILKECKVPEGLIDGIERLTKQLQEHFDAVEEKADVLKARAHYNSLVVNNLDAIDEASDLINKLDAILDAVDEVDRDVIRTNLNKLVKYFLAKAA